MLCCSADPIGFQHALFILLLVARSPVNDEPEGSSFLIMRGGRYDGRVFDRRTLQSLPSIAELPVLEQITLSPDEVEITDEVDAATGHRIVRLKGGSGQQ